MAFNIKHEIRKSLHSTKRIITFAMVLILFINCSTIYFFGSSSTVLYDDSTDREINLESDKKKGDTGVSVETGSFVGDPRQNIFNATTAASTVTATDAPPIIVPDDHMKNITTSLIKSKKSMMQNKTSSSIENASNSTFERYDGVVIVTKVVGPELYTHLSRMICMVSHAYNDRVKYDIVVFTTLPWPEELMAKIKQVAAPAKLTFSLEGPQLEEQLAAMTKEELQFLRDRCGVKSEDEKLTWKHYCTEEGFRSNSNLSYAWQSEFRAYHIWNHPAIKDYKYMMWFDSDIRIGIKWQHDPMRVMIENDLTLLYEKAPYGRTRNPLIKKKIVDTYGKSLCNIFQTPEGHFKRQPCDEEIKINIPAVAGNHHITNLHVYRKDIHQKFLKAFVGDYRFSREFDDQFAVTIPAAMEEDGSKAWHERTVGIPLRIAHHRRYDGERFDKAPANSKQFYIQANASLPSLGERCNAYFL